MKIVIEIDITKVRKRGVKPSRVHRDRKNDYRRKPKHRGRDTDA
jgi:hypothetical protein